ncbi:MAG: TIGR03617 family F420-dependent LLM class oxidoreductase [Deltaproteobacteria bacterium]|nr:TIGR03617 family F420-dependent LLM class oxidoreductase [Deltaproteobacteria bacterium]MBW2723828.1 TIGR03617 family F420-dependent LLM class oxidoreductase [Deltaproteobacteria bacterium]
MHHPCTTGSPRMLVDGGLFGPLHTIARRVEHLEASGYDGAFSAEISANPFFPLVLGAEHSERIELLTGIAVAFARNPMNLANIAHDLNAYSKGRFILGIGSQIRPHITKRFSMPWSHPAERMREYIMAMRAIWECWYEGAPLHFEGKFYNHTLMTPMFVPDELEYGAPRVMLAAVGPRMAEVAGETADGLLAHAFTTERYMREVTIPAIGRGLAKSGRDRASFQLSCPMFVVTGNDEEAMAQSRAINCKQIAFYGSTPAYRPVLEMHGWGALQDELNILSKRGEWDAMGECISDDILDEFAIVAEPKDVARRINERCGDILDRIVCSMEFADTDQQREFVQSMRSAGS